MTHIPTGIVSTAQTRSRENSYIEALESLTNKIRLLEEESSTNKLAYIRKNQIGSGMRGDKIRTYRFQEDSVRDHLTNKSASCKIVLNGNFDLLW